MSKKSEEPEFTKEQESLKENYKTFSQHALSNLYDDNRIPSTNEIIEMAEFLKNIRDKIEVPLYYTCRDYYDEGCDSTQVEFIVSLILGGVFGASIGLLFSLFILIPFYGIYAILGIMICLGLGIGYSFYKRAHRQI